MELSPSYVVQEEEPACKLLIHFYRRMARNSYVVVKGKRYLLNDWKQRCPHTWRRTEEMRVPSSMPFHEFVKGLRRVKWRSKFYDHRELDDFWGLDASVAVPEGWHKLEKDVPLTFRTRISPGSDQTMGTFAAAYNGTMLIVESIRSGNDEFTNLL